MQWNYCSTSACALLLLKKENKKLATNWALWMDFEAQARFSFSVYHHLLDISQWNLEGSQLWTFKHSKTKCFFYILEGMHSKHRSKLNIGLVWSHQPACLGKYQGRNHKGRQVWDLKLRYVDPCPIKKGWGRLCPPHRFISSLKFSSAPLI